MLGRREKIRAKVTARVLVDDATGCWIWTGPTSGRNGRGRDGRGHSYPRMSLDGGTVAVHKAMWIVEYGPVPPRKQLDHTCRNRLCVNPDHLEMVTHKTNQHRRDRAMEFVAFAMAGIAASPMVIASAFAVLGWLPWGRA